MPSFPRFVGLSLLSVPVLFMAACGPDTTAPEATAPSLSVQADQGTDRYIVMFKPGTANVDAAIDAMTKGQGVTVRHRYYSAIQGFAGSIPASALEGIRRNPLVALVTPDQVAKATGTQTLTASQWGLDRIDTRTRTYDNLYNYTADGTGVDAYILDTGINTAHPEFEGRASFHANYTTSGNSDVQGHGTHVAGTVGGATVGVAKKVNLFAVKVLDDGGSGYYSWIIAGVDEVTRLKKLTPSRSIVANMSLGGPSDGSLNTAVNNSVAAGVVWAVAAGNENTDACTKSPAAAASALTVGATTSLDARSSFSNFGTCVDVFAPGSSIYSSTTSLGYASWSGTSMASPHVAGAAALYLSANPGASASAVNNWVTSNATTGLVTSAGTGSPNRLLYTGSLDPVVTHTLTVTKDGTGSGTVSGTGISCGTDCTEAVVENTSVTLTATAASGSTFAGWTGACTNTTGTCTVTMDAAKTVTATFNGVPPVELRVADIDGTKKLAKSNWSITGTFEVRTAAGTLVSGAVVRVGATGAASGTASCTTGSTGRCSVSASRLSYSFSSVTLTVLGVTRNADTYTGTSNSDPDGDSNGTTIVITR